MITPGTVCFAKVRGYSPWPARIDILPKDVKLPRRKIPVFFYGTHQVSYVSQNDIYDFEKFKDIFGVKKENDPRFVEGMKEVKTNPKILQLGFDKSAIQFLSRFYTFDQNKANEMYNKMTEESTKVEEDIFEQKVEAIYIQSKADVMEIKADKLLYVNSRKRRLSSLSEIKTKQRKTLELSKLITKELRIELYRIDLPIITDENIADENVKDSKSDCSGKDNVNQEESPMLNTTFFKSSAENIELSRPIRASAAKFNENLQSYKRVIAQRSQSVDHGAAKIKTSHKQSGDKIVRHASTLNSKRNKANCETVNGNQRVCEHPVSTAPLVTNEVERNLRIVSQLSVIDKEIKRTLVVDNEDYEMCRLLLRKLDDMQNISLVLLCKVPEIVTTLRKCRRYKKEDSIKSKALAIYQRFYHIYEQSDIEEKIDAGAELLKRDSSKCKSAQQLMDELFVSDRKPQGASRQPSLSSTVDTPLLIVESKFGLEVDPMVGNIAELLASGALELLESYESDKSYLLQDCGDGLVDPGNLYEKLGF